MGPALRHCLLPPGREAQRGHAGTSGSPWGLLGGVILRPGCFSGLLLSFLPLFEVSGQCRGPHTVGEPFSRPMSTLVKAWERRTQQCPPEGPGPRLWLVPQEPPGKGWGQTGWARAQRPDGGRGLPCWAPGGHGLRGVAHSEPAQLLRGSCREMFPKQITRAHRAGRPLLPPLSRSLSWAAWPSPGLCGWGALSGTLSSSRAPGSRPPALMLIVQ